MPAVIPKSVTPARIAANIDVFGFELGGDEMAAIDALERDGRTARTPRRSTGERLTRRPGSVSAAAALSPRAPR